MVLQNFMVQGCPAAVLHHGLPDNGPGGVAAGTAGHAPGTRGQQFPGTPHSRPQRDPHPARHPPGAPGRQCVPGIPAGLRADVG